MTQTVEELRRRAQGGETAAQVALSRVLDGQGDHQRALALLDMATRAGDVTAATFLGARLLTGQAAPYQPDQGAGLILTAARAGGAEAALISAGLAAVGVGRAQSWPDALEYLQQAAEAGERRAQAQLGVLSSDRKLAQRAPQMASGRAPWKRLRETIDLEAWLTPPPVREVSASPRIGVVEGLAPEAACRWLIERASGRLQAVQVNNPYAGEGQVSGMRTASGAGFRLVDGDLVLLMLRARIARAMELPVDRLEAANVLHYDLSQKYDPHYDFLDPELPHFAEELASWGQRVATFLTYLNDDFEGGETDFPELGWRFKGARGDGMFFVSVGADGVPDRRTVHAGLPPTRGEKWLLSQWVRDRRQPPI